MSPEEVCALLENQRKYFDDGLSKLRADFVDNIRSYERKFAELTASLEYTQCELNDLKTKIKEAATTNKENTSTTTRLEQDLRHQHQQLKESSQRLDYLDDQGRRCNLRFSGVPEQAGETWEKCQHQLTRLLTQHLTITPMLERAHRVGKPRNNKPRDIVARFTRFPERDAVLRSKKKLRGTQIYINEDFCAGTTEARRQQMPAYHDARKRGKYVYFNYRSLVVKDRITSDSNALQRPIVNHCPPVFTGPPPPLLPPPTTTTDASPLASPLRLSPNTPPPRSSSKHWPTLSPTASQNCDARDTDAGVSVSEGQGSPTMSSQRVRKQPDYYKAS